MAINLSVTVRNARLDAIEAAIGTTPILRIRSGAKPTACADADAGDILAAMTLPSDWMAAASSGSKAMAGTWQDLSADMSGDAGHFRIYDAAGTTCHLQGSISATGGGGDMTVAAIALVATQLVNVTGFSLSDGNS